MDTLQFIKVNKNQLLLILNNQKKIKLNIDIKNLDAIIKKINFNILNDYVKNGPKKENLKDLKNTSYELYNILGFYELNKYFKNLKKNEFNYLNLILDKETNMIPFEVLHDGKDFLSDFIIFSRNFIEFSHSNQFESLNLKNDNFAVVGNPSESEDIYDDVINECNFISEIVNTELELLGPYTKSNINKIELIQLLNISSFFHFSGHFKDENEKQGWFLKDDIFSSNDINSISHSPDFIFSNSCGVTNDAFIYKFVEKGSKTIISTIGNLPSKRAVEFSKIFYKYFINKHNSVGQSILMAIRESKNKFGANDLFWCYYRLYGESQVKLKEESKKIKKHNLNKKFSYLIPTTLLIIIFLIFAILREDIDYHIEKLVIKNVEYSRDTTLFDIESQKYIKINDSLIYSKLIQNNEPVFSFQSDFSGKKMFIENQYKIFFGLDYKNDTLFYYNPEVKNKYYRFKFNFGSNNDIEVRLRKKDYEIEEFYLYFFDKKNLKRYEVMLDELINNQAFKIFDIITSDQLSDGNYYKYSPKELDLIKNKVTFNENFTLYIKKALFEKEPLLMKKH